MHSLIAILSEIDRVSRFGRFQCKMHVVQKAFEYKKIHKLSEIQWNYEIYHYTVLSKCTTRFLPLFWNILKVARLAFIGLFFKFWAQSIIIFGAPIHFRYFFDFCVKVSHWNLFLSQLTGSIFMSWIFNDNSWNSAYFLSQ